jgi:hypothetical protein
VKLDADVHEELNFRFRAARVAGNGKTRREPLVQARPLRARYPQIGHFFTGPIVAPRSGRAARGATGR